MTQNPAIHVEHITKNYGDFRAVDDVSFDVHSGEIFALLGPNGAGKSTTIRMILDIIKPDTGRISILGEPISDSIKNRLGYLPEERGLYRKVKVLDMMAYLGTLKGMRRPEAKKAAQQYLEKLDLAEHAESEVSELSKGMQQKVQFAVTVMHQPDLIIIDEPFSGLDPVNRRVIKDLLNEFRQRGGAIIMSTHQMHQVEEMADRLLMISRGQQKLYGPVEQIRQDYALHAINVTGAGDWDHLPGVTQVDHAQNGRDVTTLHLEPDVTSDQVLAAIAQSRDYRIDRFELAIPSLDEIFIRVAGEKPEVQHAE